MGWTSSTQTRELKLAYAAGQQAFQQGKPLAACPFGPDSGKGRYWIDGWTDAQHGVGADATEKKSHPAM